MAALAGSECIRRPCSCSAGIWLAAGINIIGLNAGKWLQNIGSVGVWIPAGC